MEILSVFQSKKTKAINQALDIAEKMREELTRIPKEGMGAIVGFFQITSKYHDDFSEVIWKIACQGGTLKDEKKDKFLSDLSRFFDNTGRCEYGWNRTKKGEVVTEDNVYINPKIPLDEYFNTRTVRQHLERRNASRNEVDFILKDHLKGILNETEFFEREQVNPFMERNYEFLSLLIGNYLKK